jgi:hypothetical protein
MIPFADMLGLYILPHKIVLCYTHTFQRKIPYADMLGLCKLQDKTVCKLQDKTAPCFAHYIMQRFPIAISFSILVSTKENISAKLLALQHKKRMNILWSNMIRN